MEKKTPKQWFKCNKLQANEEKEVISFFLVFSPSFSYFMKTFWMPNLSTYCFLKPLPR